jgi:glucosyl-3-phosphoglycerate phosphatase
MSKGPIVDLIRHGQSTFNAHWHATGEDPLHFDARLSELGHEQVRARRDAQAGEHYDLIISSPLTRAMQTTLGVFGDRLGKVPFLVQHLHSERVEQSGDVGRDPVHLIAEFPQFDLSHLPNGWWHNGETPNEIGVHVEPEERFQARLAAFGDWLRARPEERIAVVGHATFFYHFAGCNLANCAVHRWQP